jgi:hypothetical protein
MMYAFSGVTISYHGKFLSVCRSVLFHSPKAMRAWIQMENILHTQKLCTLIFLFCDLSFSDFIVLSACDLLYPCFQLCIQDFDGYEGLGRLLHMFHKDANAALQSHRTCPLLLFS